MPTPTRAGARRGVRASATAAVAALVTAPLALATPSASAADEPAVVPTLQWEISQQFDNHLAVHELADGATEDADGVVTFPGGVGTYDPFTGAASVAYEGSVSGTFGPNFGLPAQYTVTVADPVVTVGPSGAGTIEATVSAWNTGGSGSTPAQTEPTQVVVTTFDAPAEWTAGDGVGSITATPDWVGVLPADSEQATALGIPAGQPVEGASFAPEFLGALTPGVRAHFYQSRANQTVKKPSSFTATATPAAPPAVTYETTSTSHEDGLLLRVSGTGFRGVTVEGDNGVYVGLAPAGEMPDVSDRENTALFAGVNWVPAASIGEGGTFTTSVSAPTEKLDPTVDYALYTWQAHTYSNVSQDTQTPVTIDWSALEEPVADVTLTATGSTGQRYATTTWVAAKVAGVADGAGTVTLTGVGAAQSTPVKYGQAAFRVPATLAPGTYTARYTLATDGAGDGTTTTTTFTVLQGTSTTGASFLSSPSSRNASTVRVVVAPKTNTTGVPAAAGPVAVKFYQGNRVVWYSGVKQLAGGQLQVTVPRLPAGRYAVVIGYAGSNLLLSSNHSRYVDVR
ncbi:HtaA domain-containing protein [Nocardioides sp. ChNu-153]|uniref:HtaA domain-containing protein n=1 Tax=unclassified Nocardioides TaxID=2615069 RepID=UPI0024055294|nr:MULTISPECIES: HtaA domain-containing protein [unclassified Nocardioides]MDF9718010.1 HtaA domain-containing protein [Nocardioides sp. ChNu-99]MDN7121322.1 HtaA domain-containing protein [Nocardioides sp. ChNu-153]